MWKMSCPQTLLVLQKKAFAFVLLLWVVLVVAHDHSSTISPKMKHWLLTTHMRAKKNATMNRFH